MAKELFTFTQELQILSELASLGYVAEHSPRDASTRGHWIFEVEPPEPCVMVCPSIYSSSGHDDTGEVALILFPDGHRILHCGLSGMVDHLDPDQPLAAAVQEAEQFAAGVA